MHKISVLFVVLFCVININSQELNCLITVNSEQITGSNKQVFTTLEKSLNDYVNQTKWTDKNVALEEKIDCAITIIVSSRDANTFKATLQIQSSRPVFGSSYVSPILNIKDNDFSFKYNEFDPLIYNKNSFDSNLVSTIVFYVNIILGADADTFKKYGGEKYLKEAQNVMLQAQQSGQSSWSNQVGKQNRFLLIDNLMSEKLKSFRSVLYNYYRNGLDLFSSNKPRAKQSIENTVMSLNNIFNKTISNYLIRLFFDAKADEIVNVYSDGPKTSYTQKLKQTLKRISPNNNNKWKNIRQ